MKGFAALLVVVLLADVCAAGESYTPNYCTPNGCHQRSPNDNPFVEKKPTKKAVKKSQPKRRTYTRCCPGCRCGR